MQLIYRAQTFQYSARPTQRTPKLQVISWRYQISGKTYSGTLIPKISNDRPHAINWRFRAVAEA